MNIRLISWNAAGRVKCLAEQMAALVQRKPDVIALQEVRERSLQILAERFAHIGLEHSRNSFQFVPDKRLLKGPRSTGQLIASRWPLRAWSPSKFNIPWPECVLSVMIQSPWGAIELHTIHVPPGSSNGLIKIETLEGVYQRLAHHSKQPRILCGDLNTPQAEKPNGQILTWGQRERANGAIVLADERWHLGEYNVLRGLARFDLVDVYRSLHGYKKQDFSFCLKRNGRIVSRRRFDHVFASSLLNVATCNYLHKLREEGLSDHAPIEVVFNATPISTQ